MRWHKIAMPPKYRDTYMELETNMHAILRVTYRKTPFRAWHIELQHYPQQIGT
jgi:hypothetical protein